VSPLTDEALEAFREALRENDAARIITEYGNVNDEFETRQQRERAVLRVARTVITRTRVDTDANDAAQAFVEACGTAERQRVNLNLQFLGYVVGDVTAEDLIPIVEETIAIRNDVREAAEGLRDEVPEDVDAPSLGIVVPEPGPTPEGSDVRFEATFENLGTGLLEGVELSIEDENAEGVDLTPSRETLSRLETGASETVTLSGSVSEEGDHSVVIDARSDRVSASHRVGLTVVDKSGFLDRSRIETSEAREFLASTEAEGVDPIVERIENLRTVILKSKEQADAAADDAETREIDGVIRLAIGIVDSVVDLIEENTADGGLSTVQSARAKQDVASIREQLELAMEASI